MPTLVLSLITMLAGCVAVQDEQPVVEQRDAPVVDQPDAPIAINTADDLLFALEDADAQIRALRADIRYTREFAIAGDVQVRDGQLVFASDPGRANRRFAIEFTRLIVGSRVDDEVKIIVFNGTWFVEKIPGDKQFFKRQVVPPGETFDPLKIGQGPFPIPIGQRRADILREYDAELLDSADGLDDENLIDFAGDAYQLRLTPIEVLADDAEFEEIRLWYSRDTLLPRLARTVASDGDIATVMLIGVALNNEADIDESVFSVESPAQDAGWDIDIRPWRAPAGAGSRP